MRSIGLLVLALGTAVMPGGAQAQSARDGAFLFAYRIKPGEERSFAEGYRRHLAWHEARADSLNWLAWTVVAGPGIGLFVDGTFGIPFAAFDARVDPAGDRADAATNLLPYADPAFRYVFRLRRDLSVTSVLEEGRSAPMVQALWLTLRPGSEPAFEGALGRLSQRRTATEYAVYEMVTGGEQPTFLLLVQLPSWAVLEDPETDLARIVMGGAGGSIVTAESEIWGYRPDLTYIGKR